MTMKLAEGFEHNTLLVLSSYASSGNVPSISAAQKRGGAYSLLLPTAAAGSSFVVTGHLAIPTISVEGFYQVGLYFTSYPTLTPKFLKLYSGATVVLCLMLNSSGQVLAYSDDGTTLLGTTSGSLPTSQFAILEFRYKIADSPDGILTIRINGTEQLSVTGVDTKSSALDTVDKIGFGNGYGTNYNFGLFYIDDVVVNDTNGSVNNSWPNGLKVILLKPTADGNYSEWTPSTGSDNYALVDELPPVITDYLTSTTNGDRDTYTIENCPTGMGPIAAVIPTYWGQKSGSPACSNIKRLMRSGGSDQAGSNIALPTTFGVVKEILETSPFTSLPFTVSEIDGMEFGQQSAT